MIWTSLLQIHLTPFQCRQHNPGQLRAVANFWVEVIRNALIHNTRRSILCHQHKAGFVPKSCQQAWITETDPAFVFMHRGDDRLAEVEQLAVPSSSVILQECVIGEQRARVVMRGASTNLEGFHDGVSRSSQCCEAQHRNRVMARSAWWGGRNVKATGLDQTVWGAPHRRGKVTLSHVQKRQQLLGGPAIHP